MLFRDAAIEVVMAPLDPGPQTLAALAATLSDAERERARRLRFHRDRRRFIVARARLRELLAARLGARPDAIEFEYGKNGKPRLAHGRLHFSVAHCDDVALYAFSRSSEVGTDIEAIRAVPEADAIAAQFFSPREYAAYLALAPQERPLGFLQCWTRKEALAKATGEGLPEFLGEFDSTHKWCVHSFAPMPGFIAALAYPHG